MICCLSTRNRLLSKSPLISWFVIDVRYVWNWLQLIQPRYIVSIWLYVAETVTCVYLSSCTHITCATYTHKNTQGNAQPLEYIYVLIWGYYLNRDTFPGKVLASRGNKNQLNSIRILKILYQARVGFMLCCLPVVTCVRLRSIIWFFLCIYVNMPTIYAGKVYAHYQSFFFRVLLFPFTSLFFSERCTVLSRYAYTWNRLINIIIACINAVTQCTHLSV